MPEFNSRAGASTRFKKAVFGERPSAAETNKLQDAVAKLYSQHAVFDRLIGIEIVRVDDAIGIFDVDGSIHSDWSLQSGRSEVGDQAGFVQYFDRDQYLWLENGEEQKSGIVDPMGLVWDADEVVPMFYHRQSAKYIPLSPRTVRNAITCADYNRNYPATGSSKFPIKFVRLEYDDNGPDVQTPTTVYLDSQSTVPLSNDPDDFVLNISGDGVAIPEGTAIEVFNCIGKNGEQQWYTRFGVGGSGSDSTIIMFEIVDIYRGIGLNCNAVEARILNVSCNGTAEGDPQSVSLARSGLSTSVGNTVIIWDSLGCMFNCPMDLLIGVRGYAVRMTTPEAGSRLALEQFNGGPQPETPCRWEVTTLCCVE